MIHPTLAAAAMVGMTAQAAPDALAPVPLQAPPPQQQVAPMMPPACVPYDAFAAMSKGLTAELIGGGIINNHRVEVWASKERGHWAVATIIIQNGGPHACIDPMSAGVGWQPAPAE